jgi:CubicO group peptidase (beta-lactamase class C family)
MQDPKNTDLEGNPEPEGSCKVDGICEDRFSEVRREFERNFAERRELGACVCVMHEGRRVVDLWGGSSDEERTVPWTADTMVIVFSCTKGAVALCTHMLASEGELDLDLPLAHYWPEFRRHGKDLITVRMALNHQAGLPGVNRPLAPGSICDFEGMTKAMADEHPLWRPGSRHGYHALTFGWILGEVIRRVSTQTVGTFFRRQVAEPLGIDFWIGLPESEDHRVATTVMLPAGSFGPRDRFDAAVAERQPIQLANLYSLGELLDRGVCDSRIVRSAEIPAGNGIANARALAGMYAPLSIGGEWGDTTVVAPDQLIQMIATESAGEDAVFLQPSRFSAGFEKAPPGRDAVREKRELVISEAAFGHSGLGGAVGFADPGGRFSFGYAMNRHPDEGEALNRRYQPLIDATYRSLGHRSFAGGKWI